MLRSLVVLSLFLSFLLIACSSDQSGPTAPAGKAAGGGLSGLLGTFEPAPDNDDSGSDESDESSDSESETTADEEDQEEIAVVEEETLPESLQFNIDLVFTDSFYEIGYTQEDIETIRYAASRWEEILLDIPDWTLPAGFSPMQNVCG